MSRIRTKKVCGDYLKFKRSKSFWFHLPIHTIFLSHSKPGKILKLNLVHDKLSWIFSVDFHQCKAIKNCVNRLAFDYRKQDILNILKPPTPFDPWFDLNLETFSCCLSSMHFLLGFDVDIKQDLMWPFSVGVLGGWQNAKNGSLD